jgi:hypothetical protein
VLGPRETARVLGIRLDAVYSLIWSGKLPAEKRDGRWLISYSSVAARVTAKADRLRGGKSLRTGESSSVTTSRSGDLSSTS